MDSRLGGLRPTLEEQHFSISSQCAGVSGRRNRHQVRYSQQLPLELCSEHSHWYSGRSAIFQTKEMNQVLSPSVNALRIKVQSSTHGILSCPLWWDNQSLFVKERKVLVGVDPTPRVDSCQKSGRHKRAWTRSPSNWPP